MVLSPKARSAQPQCPSVSALSVYAPHARMGSTLRPPMSSRWLSAATETMSLLPMYRKPFQGIMSVSWGLRTEPRSDTEGMKIMDSLKQEAISAIAKLPDSADIDEIMYRLYVIDKIRKGEDSIQRGEYTTTNDLKKEIESW